LSFLHPQLLENHFGIPDFISQLLIDKWLEGIQLAAACFRLTRQWRWKR
jgi:hypothetical protein